MIKQVIFIAGTAYSGSSMLDMMIGNNEASFSAGEVQYIFNPMKPYHINPPCGCGDPKCRIWTELRNNGSRHLYKNIFKKFQYINTIVDSSKDPFWINKQQKYLYEDGISSKILLIWKSPKEFALSRKKRKQLKGWMHAWIHYHRLFLSIHKRWWSVAYRDLAKNPSYKLQQICKSFFILYNINMEDYWTKNHHMLFGNISAKYHTLDKKFEGFKKNVEHLKSIEYEISEEKDEIEKRHRTIFYRSINDNSLPASVLENAKNNKLSDIITIIKSRDIEKFGKEKFYNTVFEEICYPPSVVAIFRLKRKLRESLFRLKNIKKHKLLGKRI